MGYNSVMIKTFAQKGLERFFTTGSLAGIQAIHGKRLRLVLALLNDAAEIDDIDAPALRLHPLKGDLAGFWAVTVHANWRVIFRFEDGDAHVVDYVDYH
jgi:toxin HigB-1